MTLQTTYTLIAMVAVFVLCSWKLKSPEISMVITAIVGALVAGFGFPVRLLVEGTLTYLDLALLFITASLFMNFYSEIGATNALIRGMVKTFYDKKWLMLFLLAFVMLVPGAFTGAGSVSILVVGGLVATVLEFMGFPPERRAAFVFITAILSAAAPPINLWAMLMAAGANMPYVGFNKILFIPVILTTIFAVFFFGRGTKARPKSEVLANLPPAAKGMNWLRLSLPFVLLLLLIFMAQYQPFVIPVIGLPLTFMLCALLVILLDPEHRSLKRWWTVATNTIETVFPLVATLTSVGVLVNIMALTGVRGLIAINFVTLPIVWIYVTALLFCPLAQGSLSYGSAVILGVPIIFRFNSVGVNVTVVAAALSLMFPLGDCLPPSRIVGRLSIEKVGYKGSYMQFLKAVLVPWLFLAALALCMLIFTKTFVPLTK
ncbi:MAG TPA: citrate transporter [Bacillota bacterium]|nr:citrate transporter [Bacillota bacterium]HOH09800.1 citrate transporter [Bacillota bacterium]HOY88662.1 citrate transporter [Bacillota bacterium]HPI01885.1 citrate transporter [Bacillota bacterium]HPM63804.1 citrate transporter [Bacillota bacterium]